VWWYHECVYVCLYEFDKKVCVMRVCGFGDPRIGGVVVFVGGDENLFVGVNVLCYEVCYVEEGLLELWSEVFGEESGVCVGGS